MSELLLVNPYSSVMAAGEARYFILTDRGTITRVDVRSQSWAELFRQDSIPALEALPPSALELLLNIGYLLDFSEDPRQGVASVIKNLEQMQENSKSPPAVHIFLTHACNFRCTYCIQGHEVKTSGQGSLQADQVEQIFSALEEMAKDGIINRDPDSFTLFGGEPLQPHLKSSLRKVLAKCSQQGKEVAIVTNGFWYEECADLFRSNKDKGSTYTFLVSIDGPPEIHNLRRPLVSGRETFDVVSSSVSMMLQHGHKVILQPIVDSQNGAYLEDLLDICSRLGWNTFAGFEVRMGITMFPYAPASESTLVSLENLAVPHLSRVKSLGLDNVNVGLNDANLKASAFISKVLDGEKYSPSLGCAATLAKSISFSPDGLIYPCREYSGRGETYAIARFSPSYEVFPENIKHWYGHKISRHPKCQSCKFVLICGGGCRVASETRGRGLDDPLCPPFESTWQTFLDSSEKFWGLA